MAGLTTGYQPRHLVDVEDIDDYQKFLLHQRLTTQYLTQRLFEVKRPIVEKPIKKSTK